MVLSCLDGCLFLHTTYVDLFTSQGFVRNIQHIEQTDYSGLRFTPGTQARAGLLEIPFKALPKQTTIQARAELL